MTRHVTIKNKTGLHARPAAIFVQVANKFDSEITVKKGRQKVNGKSIMGILMLAAGQGQEVVISAEGPDADVAIVELEKILLNSDEAETVG
ncbi:MAG: HPr family phosphocarrier protein [Candidatus Omnitrophica bacterium]|nr:HPr family phosphocarrier protein [Candidatus Omnitrophota bacterium]MBU4478131.1 HPr family phosphocarrier protein [Candidatus Omnitrophota bacterium]MCG2704072.1 HPr family phosphocarrier protein [Candidatus Omnitrophota bacterium]